MQNSEKVLKIHYVFFNLYSNMQYHLNHSLGMLAAGQHKWELQLNFFSVKTKSAFKGLEMKSPEATYYARKHLFFHRKQNKFLFI